MNVYVTHAFLVALFERGKDGFSERRTCLKWDARIRGIDRKSVFRNCNAVG
jgi:hypothetical protein